MHGVVGCNVYAARPERYHTLTTADSSLASNGRTNLAESLIPACLTSAMTRTSKYAQRRLLRVAVDRAVMRHSELIPRNVKRTVEHAKNIDVSVVLHEIGDSVMTVEKYANVSRRSLVAMADLRKLNENLRAFVNALNSPSCSRWIVSGDVLEDVFEPLLSFVGPRYCCHERMRRAISSFEMVRFASESASPRSTIT